MYAHTHTLEDESVWEKNRRTGIQEVSEEGGRVFMKYYFHGEIRKIIS